MPNPLSGHTAAQLTGAADGLRDGDVITSPSVTNALEAIHGNGILRLHDSTYKAQAPLSPLRGPSSQSMSYSSRQKAVTVVVQQDTRACITPAVLLLM